jgi:hypothetical protein
MPLYIHENPPYADGQISTGPRDVIIRHDLTLRPGFEEYLSRGMLHQAAQPFFEGVHIMAQGDEFADLAINRLLLLAEELDYDPGRQVLIDDALNLSQGKTKGFQILNQLDLKELLVRVVSILAFRIDMGRAKGPAQRGKSAVPPPAAWGKEAKWIQGGLRQIGHRVV